VETISLGCGPTSITIWALAAARRSVRGLLGRPRRLIDAVCGAEPSTAREAIGAELERLWSETLRYDYWANHLIVEDDESVTLHCVTQAGPDDFFVTGRVWVDVQPVSGE
jgi:hypothetical protein